MVLEQLNAHMEVSQGSSVLDPRNLSFERSCSQPHRVTGQDGRVPGVMSRMGRIKRGLDDSCLKVE